MSMRLPAIISTLVVGTTLTLASAISLGLNSSTTTINTATEQTFNPHPAPKDLKLSYITRNSDGTFIDKVKHVDGTWTIDSHDTLILKYSDLQKSHS